MQHHMGKYLRLLRDWRVFAILAGAAVLACAYAPVVGAADDKPGETPSPIAMRQQSNHLKQLALAMHNYHDVHKGFPPAAVFDKDGKPLLSWRVLLLPYLEEKKLFDEFHLYESWDSEHNKKLLERMPKVFDAETKAFKPGETVFEVFTGKGTVFEGKKGIRITDIMDGTSNTLMIVESARPVPWTKPEDLPYNADKPLPKLGLFEKDFNAAFCDGSVRRIRTTVPEKTLRALITRNDGEVIDYSKF
jgi:prepilin-type processing-associated H-X9-DG protein